MEEVAGRQEEGMVDYDEIIDFGGEARERDVPGPLKVNSYLKEAEEEKRRVYQSESKQGTTEREISGSIDWLVKV